MPDKKLWYLHKAIYCIPPKQRYLYECRNKLTKKSQVVINVSQKPTTYKLLYKGWKRYLFKSFSWCPKIKLVGEKSQRKVNINVREYIKLIQAIVDWILYDILFEEIQSSITPSLVYTSTAILISAKIQGVENAWNHQFIFSRVGYKI